MVRRSASVIWELLEMGILRPYPRPAETEILEQPVVVTNPSGDSDVR